MTYDNPLDNVHDLAHHFFKRCLEHDVVPYVVTKKTVFKWQEGFWLIMKKVWHCWSLSFGLLSAWGCACHHCFATLQNSKMPTIVNVTEHTCHLSLGGEPGTTRQDPSGMMTWGDSREREAHLAAVRHIQPTG